MNKNMKRSIIMTLIYCIGIGGLTLFIGALYPVHNTDGVAEAMNKKKEAVNSDEVLEARLDNDDITKDKKTSSTALASTATATPIPSPTPIPTSTPTPPPVYEIVKGQNPEIEKFFNDYYVAWNSCDYSLIKNLTTSSNNAIPLLDLQNETRFLDDIRDITCYTMKSYEDDAYIVYVYYELKYVNIKTPLPQLDKFYLVNDEAGNLKIFNSEMDEMLKAYIDERDNDDKVQEIIQTTNDKAKEALDKDEHLRVYVEALFKK